MACACDVHPCAVHAIPAGLPSLPRALGTFPHWRTEVLAAIAREGALREWRSREAGDFGMMLVEFFAYMGDVTSFYDGFIAGETYLRTATLPDAARRMVALLGYLPRPALASSVWLAAEADGVRLVTLPVATAFRSGEFDGNPPQVFESGAARKLEPRLNRLAVDRVPATALPSPLGTISVRAGTLRAAVGQIVVLDMGGALAASRIAAAAPQILRTRRAVTSVNLSAPVTPPAGATYATARLLRAAARTGAWKLTPGSGEPAVLSSTQVSLEARAAIAAGDIVVIEAGGVLAPRRVTAVGEVQYTLLASLSSTLTDPDGNVSTMASPAIKTGVTQLTLDSAIPFSTADVPSLIVHHALSSAGQIHVPLKDVLEQGDPVLLPGLLDAPRIPVTEMALEDIHAEAAVASGTLDPVARRATLDSTPAWDQPLTQAVTLNGNVFLATRGESVHDEVLGAGDASAPQQTFRLKKKPLTYLPAANAAGRTSSLVIHVGGIEWEEVESFYGQPRDAQVYIVRHDESGEADITFGGAARVPTGAPIIANYRFGGGGAGPPAGSVKQVAKPVAGVRGVRNPLPAFGGADAEAPVEIAIRGPASALLLGRAVSLLDFETAALERSGVRAAKASWRWDAEGQRPAIMLRYIGDAQLAPTIRAALRAIAEEDAPVSVVVSPPQPASLNVDIAVDPRFVANDVADAVGQALFSAATLPGTGGLLRGERLGPDGVVFASIIIRAIMEVEGVTALNSLGFDGTPFTQTGRKPATGSWFDFAAGGVRVNGRLAG